MPFLCVEGDEYLVIGAKIVDKKTGIKTYHHRTIGLAKVTDDVFDRFYRDALVDDMTMVGPGEILFETENKKIKIYGYSSKFSPDTHLTVEMLEAAFSVFVIPFRK